MEPAWGLKPPYPPVEAKGKKEDERGERRKKKRKERSLVLKKKIIASSCGSTGGVLLVLLIVLADCVLWCRRRKNRKGVCTLDKPAATLHTMTASTSPQRQALSTTLMRHPLI